jgi:hypothetical protein
MLFRGYPGPGFLTAWGRPSKSLNLFQIAGIVPRRGGIRCSVSLSYKVKEWN